MKWGPFICCAALLGFISVSAGAAVEDKLTSTDYFELGNKQAQKGDLVKALESYRKSIQLNPANENAWKAYDNAIKDTAKLIGDLIQVKDSLRKAIQKDPLNEHIWFSYDYLVNTMTNLEVGISTRGTSVIEGKVTYYLSEFTPQKADVDASIFLYKGDLGTLPITDDPNFLDKYPVVFKSVKIGTLGEYKFADLPPGKYTVVIRSDAKKGPGQFQKGLVVQRIVTLKPGQSVNVSNYFGASSVGTGGGSPAFPSGSTPRGY